MNNPNTDIQTLQKFKRKYVLNFEDLQYIIPAFRSKTGAMALKLLYSLAKIEKVNQTYANSCHLQGAQFVDSLLKDLKIKFEIKNEEILNRLPKGAFVTVSNHPYGALDGILLIHLLASHRPDYKVMVNWILTYIEAMSVNFIAVEPTPNSEHRQISMSGIRASMKHVREGHPIGFFPAGAVSKIRPNLRIEDREWQPSVIRLIQQFKVPVVPIYFHGHNSLFYNLLGIISWKLRTLRLPNEVFNKEHKIFKITIGEPIPVSELNKYKDLKSLGTYLKEQTYKLKKL
ncbi:lysophospholipid acyltransferase family protein [Coprobacter tertius]|uniref:Lysophospholipid acyltransferase family protein n=1 Tax=Coprobacter tertius TaxID=2944915 RepID=A0ABT1MH83_9BACT|nr:lysophospholipid acyltransferase family protein [Coprobacter tertius]MCP9611982.1 lysophospholipid acyltransferase family protein [Coprobacter tertius]